MTAPLLPAASFPLAQFGFSDGGADGIQALLVGMIFLYVVVMAVIFLGKSSKHRKKLTASGARNAKALVDIRNLDAGIFPDSSGVASPSWRCTIVNRGTKVITHLEVEILYKGANGQTIASEIWIAICAGAGLPPLRGGGVLEMPGYRRAQPKRLANWKTGSVSARISRIELSR